MTDDDVAVVRLNYNALLKLILLDKMYKFTVTVSNIYNIVLSSYYYLC